MIDWTRLTPAVERAAGIAASSFPAHHDISDVKQELWVWIMENKNTITRILSEPESTVAAVERLLIKAAHSYLKKEDAASYGYPEEDQFFYSLDLIKSILEVVFKHEDWESFATALDAMPKGKSDPSHAGNNLASYSDVKSAVEHLPEDQYNVIVWRYKYQYTQAQIGAEMGYTRERARQVLDAALSSIQRFLGKRPLSDLRGGYEGRTEPQGTAAANARTEHDYNG